MKSSMLFQDKEYDSALSLVEQGEKYFKDERLDLALESYIAAIKIKPIVTAFIGKTKVYLKKGDVKSAKLSINNAKDITQDDSVLELINSFEKSLDL